MNFITLALRPPEGWSWFLFAFGFKARTALRAGVPKNGADPVVLTRGITCNRQLALSLGGDPEAACRMPERGKTGKSNRQHLLHTAGVSRWQAKPVQPRNSYAAIMPATQVPCAPARLEWSKITPKGPDS
jgi:hypothetical protein